MKWRRKGAGMAEGQTLLGATHFAVLAASSKQGDRKKDKDVLALGRFGKVNLDNDTVRHASKDAGKNSDKLEGAALEALNAFKAKHLKTYCDGGIKAVPEPDIKKVLTATKLTRVQLGKKLKNAKVTAIRASGGR